MTTSYFEKIEIWIFYEAKVKFRNPSVKLFAICSKWMMEACLMEAHLMEASAWWKQAFDSLGLMIAKNGSKRLMEGLKTEVVFS